MLARLETERIERETLEMLVREFLATLEMLMREMLETQRLAEENKQRLMSEAQYHARTLKTS